MGGESRKKSNLILTTDLEMRLQACLSRFLLAYQSLYGAPKSNSIKSSCLAAGVIGGMVSGAGQTMVANGHAGLAKAAANNNNNNNNGSPTVNQPRRASVASIKWLEVSSFF